MYVKMLTTRAKRAVQDYLTFTLPKVRVKLEQGIVRGCEERLPDGRSFQRFSGIPYAQPPVNELRFQSPRKLEKFKQEEIDCTREGDPCFHRSPIQQKYIGSEDCLNMNIYVPSNPARADKLPVMMYIHGGGFSFDSNSRDFFSPEYLLMEDVIVVVINYRLHALGFLSLPSVGISGNAGLKDQQMGLQWVHENISNFNGDPDNICLFGESAGAACAHLHVLNEKSKKFIKSAILQSSYALCDWLFQKDGPGKARRLAKMLGANSNSDEDFVKALMKATSQQLYDNSAKTCEPNADELRRSLPFILKPVIENESDDSFITMSPAELMKKQKIDIPMILGLNNGDGMTMGNYYRNNKLPSFDNDYVRLLPLSLNVDPFSHEALAVAKSVKEFYFGDKHINEETISQFVEFMTDFHFTIPQTMSNELHARHCQPGFKQYVYEFCYDGELNAFKKLLKMSNVHGACHFDELFYLFDAKILGMEVAENSPAWNMRTTMCKLWTNFAKYHDPTPDHHNPLPIKWNPVGPADESSKKFEVDYLMIDEKSEMKKNIYQNRMDFWRSLYEKYNSSFINPKF